jgi:glutaredoxin
MANWRGLLSRARRVAQERLPPEVKQAGRRLRDEVSRRAPAPVADMLDRLAGPAENEAADAPVPEPTPTPDGFARPSRDEMLQRVKSKAERGLKPEDRLVVIYATPAEADAVASIRASLEGIETTIREMDLDRERPQTARQIAQLTGVMVPPYVYINGRYWGGPFDMISLRERGELEDVVANRLDKLSPEAKRLGGVHESYSDEISVQNILERWKLGHILCVDDLDAWYEVDKDGTEHFFYQGGPQPVETMKGAAAEIVAAVEAEEYEAHWMLEPAVHLN